MGSARTAIVIATVWDFIGPPAMAQCYAPHGLFISNAPNLAFSGLNVARTTPPQVRVHRCLHRDFSRRRDHPRHGGFLRPAEVPAARLRNPRGRGGGPCWPRFFVLAPPPRGGGGPLH